MALATVASRAESLSYVFSSTPLAQALSRISAEHPETEINFIYNELESYRTSANVDAVDVYDAVRQAVGFNPVAVSLHDGVVYVEALQHGRYTYRGRVQDAAGVPLEGATVMLLQHRDSTVVTYAVTDDRGGFAIPCDHRDIVAKVSCVGFKTRYIPLKSFNVGTVTLIALPISLKGVTVESDNASFRTDRTVYLPTSRQKKAASDAIELLRSMAIPQIRVSASGGVSDNFGEPVSIFINSMPASAEEQTGLLTADVRRVEFLEYPADPRFRGAKKVINFIVHEYEYGGYTKLTVKEKFLSGFNNDPSVFSKFSYKKMKYDLYVGTSNSDKRHFGTSVTGDYLLTGEDGLESHVIRDEQIGHAHVKTNSYPVTLRATYAVDKLTVRNTVGFTHQNTPVKDITGSLRYSDDTGRGYSYERSNPDRSNSLNYSGDLYMQLPHGVAFTFGPSFNYSHRNDMYSYSSTASSAIMRHARENAYEFDAPFDFLKKLNDKHMLAFRLETKGWYYRLNYRGTDNLKQNLDRTVGAAIINYRFDAQKISLAIMGGGFYMRHSADDIAKSYFCPVVDMSITYRLSTKSALGLHVNFSQRGSGVTEQSADILQSNELMYISGNPDLDYTNQMWNNIQYNWFPSNRFSVGVYASNYTQFNCIKQIYAPYDNGKAVVRNYVNDGRFFDTKIGFNASLRLFDGALQLILEPEQHFYRHTGIDARSYNPFTCMAGASLYLGDWYFNGWYYSPTNIMEKSTSATTRERNYYMVTAGWSHNMWNVSVTAYNMFNRGWNGGTTVLPGKYYSERTVADSNYYRPRIGISVTYTVGYGRKINRNNEVGAQESASSAIRK